MDGEAFSSKLSNAYAAHRTSRDRPMTRLEDAAIPGATLGVVGGGQLGRMLAEAAGPLGVDVVVSDPTPDCPASSVAAEQVLGDFDDPATVRRVAEKADVLTFEIELTDPDALEAAGEAAGISVHPHPDTLRLIEDKLRQNRQFRERGIPVPDFMAVDDRKDLETAADEFGFPLMCKARRGGYDGRGNFLVDGPDDIGPTLEAAPGPMLAERFVPFDREVSVIGIRGADGTAAFPAGENIHEEEILRQTIVPARTDPATLERAREVAGAVLEEMSGRGVFGIELFEVDGEILVNEVAPRPHNSGHWSIEGAHCSQFEQHVRAVLGAPLGETSLRDPVVTSNILGDVDESRPATPVGIGRVLDRPGAHLHWYGKHDVRPLRKMGHVTVVPTSGEDVDALEATARNLTDGITFRE